MRIKFKRKFWPYTTYYNSSDNCVRIHNFKYNYFNSILVWEIFNVTPRTYLICG